jgi:hypothetical protein
VGARRNPSHRPGLKLLNIIADKGLQAIIRRLPSRKIESDSIFRFLRSAVYRIIRIHTRMMLSL